MTRARLHRVSDSHQPPPPAVRRVEAGGISRRSRGRDARGPRQAGQDWRRRRRQGVGGERSWRRAAACRRRPGRSDRTGDARRRRALRRSRSRRTGGGREPAAHHRAVARHVSRAEADVRRHARPRAFVLHGRDHGSERRRPGRQPRRRRPLRQPGRHVLRARTFPPAGFRWASSGSWSS